MTYNRLNLTIIIRLIILLVSCFLLVLSIIQYKNFFWGTALFVVLVIEVAEIVYFINTLNRKLGFFFDAIKNEDTTLLFPEKVKNKSLQTLHKSLNRVNNLIADIKIKNENNERFFKELVEHSATGLISFDSKGYVDIINETAKKYIHVPHIANISILKQKNKELYNIFKLLRSGETKVLKMVSGNEYINLSIKASVLKFDNNKYKLISLNNIKKELEENEITSWQKLIRILTHEIMNSIAPITSLTNTISRYFKKNDIIKKPGDISDNDISNTLNSLNVIEDMGKGLMHFVDNYKKLAKAPVPVIKKISTNKWMNNLKLMFEDQIKENHIELTISCSKNLNEFNSDEQLLNQVIINMVNNAIDSFENNENKKIDIKLRNHNNESIIIQVIDNGKGIKSDMLDKIFIPFFTTKNNGNGIGLSLSRQIIQSLNGSVNVKSEIGKGTIFSIEL